MEPTERSYTHIWQAVTETAWAILPSTLDAIVEVLTIRGAGLRFTADEIAERVNAAATGPRVGARQSGAIAVLPLYGTIAQRMGVLTAASGGTSTEAFGRVFDQAVADPQIGAILLEVDSPGGSVSGVTELASKIYAARGRKPIVANINSLGASAAYWIAAMADEISITTSGMAGSIGVRYVHQEESEKLAKDGVKTTIISAGKFKSEGHPSEPLDDEALAHIRSLVEENYDSFVSDVAKGRGVSVSTVRSGYGEGRVLTAKASVKAGLVDRVETIDATIDRLMKRRPVALGAGPQRAEAYDLRRRRLALGAPAR
jgi:capsid assembly protease